MSLGSRIAAWSRFSYSPTSLSRTRRPLLSYPTWDKRASRFALISSAGQNHKSQVQDLSLSSNLPAKSQSLEDGRMLVDAHDGNFRVFGNHPSDAHSTNLDTSSSATVGGSSLPLTSAKQSEDQSRQHETLVRQIEATMAGARERLQNVRRNRHLYYQRSFEEHGIEQSQLPDILTLLNENTPKDSVWLEKAFLILIPRLTAEQLLHGLENTIWEIAGRYDCTVQPAYVGMAKGMYLPFSLSGGVISLRRTLVDLRRLYPEVIVLVSDTLSQRHIMSSSMPGALAGIQKKPNDRGGLVRNVFCQTPRRASVINHSMEKNYLWDPWTFVEHIEHLTRLRTRDSRGLDHVRIVTERLNNLFLKPDSELYVTLTAFKQALQYLVKYNSLDVAKIIFVRMEMIGLQLDTEIFNIMIRKSAQIEDQLSTTYLLGLMLKRGFKPNAKTWIACLMASRNLGTTIAIANAMFEKGLLHNTSTMRAVIEHTVTSELNVSIHDGRDLTEFLLVMSHRYGPSWLNPDIAHRILTGLGLRGLISKCREFMEFMAANFVPIRLTAVNQVLHHCRSMSNVNGAVTFLRSLPPSLQDLHDRDTFHILFNLAWDTEHYNVAKLVWKYAVSRACTTHRMRNVLTESLAARPKNIKPNLVIPAAALFVTGVEECTHDDDMRFKNLIRETFNSYLRPRDEANQIPHTRSYNPTRKMISKYMQREYELVHDGRKSRLFVTLLEEALSIDQGWDVRIEDPQSLAQLDQMLTRGIDLRRKDKLHIYRHFLYPVRRSLTSRKPASWKPTSLKPTSLKPASRRVPSQPNLSQPYWRTLKMEHCLQQSGPRAFKAKRTTALFQPIQVMPSHQLDDHEDL